jgi:hypothetical protein
MTQQPCLACGKPTTSARYCRDCFKWIGSTLLGQATANPDLAEATITGLKRNGVGVALPVANWSVDPVGTEPPLGININELPALGGAGGGDGSDE